jgi:peptidase E
MNTLCPIYMFSDSQLLFLKLKGVKFFSFVKDHRQGDSLKAAYIGASNEDNPEFYNLFEGAMENIGITDCRMIQSSFLEEDQAFLEVADIILLAGGDVELGWNVFQLNGMDKAIIRKYETGALLIGISAGAVQLGLCGCNTENNSQQSVFDTFQIVPYIIGAHEEKQDWEQLKKLVQAKGEYSKGIGIPMGGGMIYHVDKTIEPIRYPLCEVAVKDNETIQNWLIPNPEYEEIVFHW